MKKSIIFTSALALLFSACEMKDELWSTNPEHSAKGALALNVSANSPESIITRAAVSTDNFEVSITNKEDAEITYSYTVSEMPSKVTIPVGSYTVTAHTPGELERQMPAPYYSGTAEVNIEENITSNKEIACTMANSRISIKYDEEFLNTFATWTITVDDGTDQALVYTEENLNPADIFWYFKNDAKNITVNIRAFTKKGNKIESSATYNKQNCEEGYTNIENECFTGGDAINISFIPVEEGLTTGKLTGIDIETSVTFDNESSTVTLNLKDVDDNNDEPVVNPSDPAVPSEPIVITEPNGTSYLTDGITYTQYWEEEDEAGIPYYLNYPNDVALHFEMPNGLKHLYVLISGSEDFEFMTGLMGLTAEPYGLDLTDSSDENTAEIANMDLFTMPVIGAKTYDFAFSEGIWRLLPGFIGKQSFKLRAVDAQDNVKESTLVVTINAME